MKRVDQSELGIPSVSLLTLEIVWFALTILTIATPIVGYNLQLSTYHNYMSLTCLVGSLMTGMLIYVNPERKIEHYENFYLIKDQNQEDSRILRKQLNLQLVNNNLTFYQFFINGDSRQAGYIKASILILVVLFIISCAGYFYAKYDFDKHKSLTKQYNCEDYEHEKINIDLASKGKYFPVLLASDINKNIKCKSKSEIIEMDFLPWLFFVGDYYAAVGERTIVMTNNSIEIKAIWFPIYSRWFKFFGTRTSMISDVIKVDIFCHKSEASNSPIISPSPSRETPDQNIIDDYFTVLADIKIDQLSPEHLRVNGIAQLSLTPYWLSEVEPNSPLLMKVNFGSVSDTGGLISLGGDYICESQIS